MPGLYEKVDIKQVRFIKGDAILRAVANYFGLTEKDLFEKNRKRKTVYPRHIAMYLIRTYCNLSWVEISNQFSYQHHTTLVYSHKKIQDLIEVDVRFRNEIKDISENI